MRAGKTEDVVLSTLARLLARTEANLRVLKPNDYLVAGAQPKRLSVLGRYGYPASGIDP